MPVKDTMDLLTVNDLAEITKESVAVWRKRIFHRQIPFVKLGTNVRVRRVDLDEWLKNRLIAK